MCFSCLNRDHGIKSCRARKACGIEVCARLHHPDLHEGTRPRLNYHQANTEIREEKSEAEERESGGTARVHTAERRNSRVALGTIPVRVKDRRGQMVIARALVDEGSDTSLASAGFISKLGFSGRKRTLRIGGAADERQYESGQQELDILTRTNKRHTITVWTLPKLCETVNPVDWKALQRRYPHLADLDLETPVGLIDLLLGMDQLISWPRMESDEVRLANRLPSTPSWDG